MAFPCCVSGKDATGQWDVDSKNYRVDDHVGFVLHECAGRDAGAHDLQ